VNTTVVPVRAKPANDREPANRRSPRPRRLTLLVALVLASCVLTPVGAAPRPAEAEGHEAALGRLDARLAAAPEDLAARAERAERREALGRSMGAFLDRLEILRQRPEDADVARLAAYHLMAVGAPMAAAALLERHPAAVSGEAGAALAWQLRGDLAARRIRWGWAEPVFDPSERRHEAEAAISALATMREERPEDPRAAGDLLLALRLADRMAEAIALWEGEIRHQKDPPYWLRNSAADAYLAAGNAGEAEALYRTIADERPSSPEPWLGLYWATLEQRRYGDARTALGHLAAIPGQELTARIQEGWLLLFEERMSAALAHFEELASRRPGHPRVREGLATAQLWQGKPREGLRQLEELLARTTAEAPFVDHPAARIARAGAVASLGELAEAREAAADLVTLYPEHLHARRLERDVETMLAPELRLDGRYDTSDRGLGETWTQLEASFPLGSRARLAAGGHLSRSEDERYRQGDVEVAYLGLAARPRRWLVANGEVAWDVHGGELKRDPAARARLGLLPDDHWRLELGYALDDWRDLPLRARADGMTADTVDLAVGYGSSRWQSRLGGGRSQLSDGNERTWALAAAELLARQGPVYRARFGAEAYGSDNRSSDVAYFSPARDRSAALTHRSEWVTVNAPGRRHSFSVLVHGGVYDQEGFAAGAVGGVWLQSDWDLGGRTVLVLGAGARSQLYDGSRELDPRLWLTLRRRF
jgi:Flp pilus assembly protein TadD